MGIRTQLLDINNWQSWNSIALDLAGKTGSVYYVDATNGSDTYSGLYPDHALATVVAALAKCTANKNDVVALIANDTSQTLTANLDWNKDYTHLVGLCAPVGAGKRARFFQDSGETGMDLFTVSANGCVFRNLYFFHGVDDATSLICATVTGERNYFENCHFAGIGHATMSAAGSASLKIDGGAENLFKNCQIGLDTIARDADATELWLDGAATRNVFEDCQFYGYISAAGYATVTIEDGTGIDRYLKFKNCEFFTDSTNQAVAQTSVFNIKAAIVQGKIILKDCMAFTDGAAEWDSNNRGIIYANMPAAAASAAGGIGTNQ